MRLTTLIALLVAIVAIPGARLAGVIGGPDGGASVVTTAAHPDARTVPRLHVAPPATVPVAAPPPTTTPPANVVPVTTQPVVRFTPTVVYTVAHIRPTGVNVYSDPNPTQPTFSVSGQTEFATPRVLTVIAQLGTWLKVRLPVRPNNAFGWVKAADVDLSAVGDQIFVSLDARELEWFHGATLVMQARVGIGAPSSPTPPGEYYVTDLLPSSGAYGPVIVALNGHSDTYTDFAGGDARLAIHGTDDPSTIGAAASHGCVHLPNDLDTTLATAIQPGTLVEIS